MNWLARILFRRPFNHSPRMDNVRLAEHHDVQAHWPDEYKLTTPEQRAYADSYQTTRQDKEGEE